MRILSYYVHMFVKFSIKTSEENIIIINEGEKRLVLSSCIKRTILNETYPFRSGKTSRLKRSIK